MTIVLRLLSALLPTILIEYGVLLMLGERLRRVLLSSVVVNCLTNVPLNLYMLLAVQTGKRELLVAEGMVVIIETLWYNVVAHVPIGRASVYGVLCNAISFLTGILFQTLYLLLTQ